MPPRSSDKPSMIISIVSLACSIVSAIADFLSLFGTHRKFQHWQLKVINLPVDLLIQLMKTNYAVRKKKKNMMNFLAW